jgi:hypothetical protein
MPDLRPGDPGERGRGQRDRFPVGLTFFLPGLPQWLWRQRERGVLLFGSFAASLAVGLFAWGTKTGLALIAVAYVAHVVSAADAIRQWAFPGFGRWIPTVSASAGLGAAVYGPVILFGSLVAWPGRGGEEARDGYLVNRLAYQGCEPEARESVWLQSDGYRRSGRLAEVLARPGEEVEWADSSLRVRGRTLDFGPFKPGQLPRVLAFKVPEDHYLIATTTGNPFLPRSWELVPRSRIEGRAWAKLYPIWERKLLP